ncbi:hypothetical protein CASFOL_027978 [Castilleja foliolosa]|uniref:AAA+ ATPase domain-containing protein n=1 Tax=Castilleja foliolosa TaxID=1961234 RepID=A0ABD3CH96_9LAMI
MDGRRHSVDIPISRKLIALSRVRSLRDPSTHSMSKLSALIDNFNWDTNSNNSITLGFDTNFIKGTPGEEQKLSEHELYYSTSHRKSNARVLDSETGEKYCLDYEGGGSCDEISTQNENRLHKKSNFKICHGKLGSDVLSPYLYQNEDVGFMGSCHQGCGISSCWSRARKSKDSNFEELPLLITGEKLSYSESSPRNLCQKFTPKSFGELIGQATVSNSLLNAISKRQINSMYLFHGPRGTGKTSASGLFAAALNCISLNFAKKPCGLCQECSLFFSGRSRDFREIDALEINKMERCKSLVKSMWDPPVYSRYKVYVVDECHLLNRETWAVILGGLEGISKNVVFIMVTPSLDKVPRSVVSKARVYHFQRVKEVDIAGRLGKMCVLEGLEFEEDALNFIANKSNGSLRDAEMMLDQLSLLGRKITVPLVYEVNGVVSNDELLDLLHLALSSDASNTVKQARELLRSGIEPLQLVSQLANLIMDILAGKLPDGVSEIRKKPFGNNSEAAMQQLSHALKILSQAEKQLRTTKNQTTWFTVALLQLSSTESSSHDMNDARLSTATLNPPEGDFHSTSSTGESLKCSVACGCDEDEPEKVVINTKHDDKETLDLVWLRAIGICTPRSFKKFLRKRGKLVDIRLMHGTAVAELEFDRLDYVRKAEKSWKVIAGALQCMLGYNVELRINLSNNETNKHEKFKNRYFSLFNCSRRVQLKSNLSECKCNASDTSVLTPKTLTKDKYVETCSSECGSHIAHSCCHAKELFKTIRSKDGNALCIGMSTPSMARDDKSKSHIWNDRANKDGPCPVNLKPENEPGRKEHSKFRCWKTAMFPFRKAWQLRHQPRSEGLVDYALHCAAAK